MLSCEAKALRAADEGRRGRGDVLPGIAARRHRAASTAWRDSRAAPSRSSPVGACRQVAEALPPPAVSIDGGTPASPGEVAHQADKNCAQLVVSAADEDRAQQALSATVMWRRHRRSWRSTG